jgi:hypothetical protein
MMTPEELAAARANQALVFDTVMRAITALHPMPEEGEGAGGIDFFPTIDGLLQSIASLVVTSGAFPTARERREFAENMRKSLIRHMADIERAVESGDAWQSRQIEAMPRPH